MFLGLPGATGVVANLLDGNFTLEDQNPEGLDTRNVMTAFRSTFVTAIDWKEPGIKRGGFWMNPLLPGCSKGSTQPLVGFP